MPITSSIARRPTTPAGTIRGGLVTFLVAPLVVAGLAGCSANPQVKIASTEFTAALGELRTASRDFRGLYTGEIRKTREEIRDAIVARAVRKRVERISEELDDRDSELAARGLVSLADELAQTEEEYRKLAELVDTLSLAPEERAAGGFQGVLDRQIAAARTTAARMRELQNIPVAEELEARARALEEKRNLDFLADEKIGAYIDALLALREAADEAAANLGQLDALVRVLQETHSVVHGWIMTDVKVSGERLANLFQEHAGKLGLTPGRAPGEPPDEAAGDGGDDGEGGSP